MAELLVGALVKSVVGILTSSPSLQEIALLWGLKDDLDHLRSTFTTLQSVLQDAEIKQRKSPQLKDWLRKLKDAACDAENILDEMQIENFKRKIDSNRGISFFSKRNPLYFRVKMAHKIKNIRKKLSAVADERLKFHLGEGVMENRFGLTSESRKTNSLVNELEIFGRKDEKEMILEKLLDDRNLQDDLSVYAICGMGGLGKTTLAQMVYNDEKIGKKFELRIWVCVSEDFSIPRLVRAIIESIDGSGGNVSELDPLQRLLHNRLGGRRFLLVLDDVWNENHMLWDELRKILRCGSKGNVVVVTTRIGKVASMMETIGIHHIGCLAEEDSWSLFKQRASPKREAEFAIGKRIVKKCGGVPLAVKALGCLMQFKCGDSEWLAVEESEIWNLPDAENGILPALRLSYDNLQPEMKQCFAYCCLFPKGYKMEDKVLIQLWMANGFVPFDGQKDLFLTGHLIFKELVWRSFFQDIQYESGRRTFKIHDLMHDLAVSIMGHETHILQDGKVEQVPKMVRHFSFNLNAYGLFLDSDNEFKLQMDDSFLRSLVARGAQQSKIRRKALSSFLSKQPYLRALKMDKQVFLTASTMDSCYIENLQKQVCKLEHLRFLCMSCHEIKRLPESLCHLYNLQTLKLMDAERLLELPENLKVMKSLMFLEIDVFDSLLCTPPGLGELSHLCELCIFIVGQGTSQEIDQLKALNLGGELTIKGLNNVRNLEEAKSANLKAKKKLTSLSLYWEENNGEYPAEHFVEVLDGLEPSHENLRKICITWYKGNKFPNWMSQLAFEKLEEVRLVFCPGCEHLPPLGKLRFLKRLYLYGMDSLKRLGAEWHGDVECSFPALTSLEIRVMPNLEEWGISNSVKSFPHLTSLIIDECPKLDMFPLSSTLRNLCLFYSNEALVSSVRYLTSLRSFILHHHGDGAVLKEALNRKLVTLERLHLGGSNINRSLSADILGNISSLKVLGFRHCLIESFPEEIQCLNSLEQLSFLGCNALTSFSTAILQGLSSLRTLKFQHCKKLKSISGPMSRGTALEFLWMYKLPEFESFPENINDLVSLSELRISHCENLKTLPEGFKHLKLLRYLHIEQCPQLEKGCKKPHGKEWPKISHVPFIKMNHEIVQKKDQATY